MFAGVAANTATDTLHDAAVWFPIDYPKDRGGPDTLVFAVGDVAPLALVPFAGGSVLPSDSRSVRGTWIDASAVARVDAAFDHRLREFRGAGGAPPTIVPADEIPDPKPAPPRDWDPSAIDLFVLLVREPFVVARVRTSSDGNTSSELVAVDLVLMRNERSTPPPYVARPHESRGPGTPAEMRFLA